MRLFSKYVVIATWMSLSACGGSTTVDNPEPADITSGHVTWSQFLSSTWREPGGPWIVDGDIPVHDEKRLRAFYDRFVRDGALIVHQANGADAKWSDEQKRQLTYCVASTFGSRHQETVAAMEAAAAAWEAVADVDFVHLAQFDASCTAQQTEVVFDVGPAPWGASYFARAFFPDQPRDERNVLIGEDSFGQTSPPSLVGVLRHELGHALGFRHEHTRPQSGTCFEDNDWRPLTDYDQASVMHYPHCNGTGDWTLDLSTVDAAGAALLYGAPSGVKPPAGPDPMPTTKDVFTGSVLTGQSNQLDVLPVVPKTELTVSMTGTGDPDLYVRFDGIPNDNEFACRPYIGGAVESCRLTVPVGAKNVHVMVHGYSSGTYEVTVVRAILPPEGGCFDADTGEVRAIASPAPGDLVISEVLQNPRGTDTSGGEFVEVVALKDVDLNGVRIEAKGSGAFTGVQIQANHCVRLPAGSFAVFSNNADSTTNGGLPFVTWKVNFALNNSAGTVQLRQGATVLDAVSWSAAAEGVSHQLDPSAYDATLNDVPTNFCAGELAYGNGENTGTPGADNHGCSSARTCVDPTTQTVRNLVLPKKGDLVISELQLNPAAVADSAGEFFEVFVTRDVDLNGLQIANEATGNTTLKATECIRAVAGSYLVFARKSDAAVNGGLQNVTGTFGFNLANTGISASPRQLILRYANVEIDQVSWIRSTSGASTQLSADQMDATANDVPESFCDTPVGATYGAGDRGTPGLANRICQ